MKLIEIADLQFLSIVLCSPTNPSLFHKFIFTDISSDVTNKQFYDLIKLSYPDMRSNERTILRAISDGRKFALLDIPDEFAYYIDEIMPSLLQDIQTTWKELSATYSTYTFERMIVGASARYHDFEDVML